MPDTTANIGSKDLNVLFALRVLLEESNVTRAANRLGIGQPAMSAMLSRLRGHYGDELLARFGRDYELTPLARVLLPHVQEATALIERSLGVQPLSFDPLSSERAFTVLASRYGACVIQDGVTRVATRAPGVRVEMIGFVDVEGARQDWMAHDLVVATAPGGVEYRSYLLRRDPYVCVANRRHPGLRDERMTWDAFVDCDFAVGRGVGADADSTLHQALMNRGMDLRPVLTVDNTSTVLDMVSQSDLVAVVPKSVVDLFHHDDEVVVFGLPVGGELTVSVYLNWHRSRDADPGLRWLVGTLSDETSPAAVATDA